MSNPCTARPMAGLSLREINAKFAEVNKNLCYLQAQTSSIVSDRVDGQSQFTADGITTVFNITHNAGFVPGAYSITSSQPVSANHLTRTITFPDNNTMRLTFGIAPSPGEDANYVWVLYR